MNGQVTIVIVNFNSGRMLARCIQTFRGDSVGSSARIIVIDNASSDSSLLGIDELPGVEVVPLQENIGFGAANNLGIDMCTTPYVLMVNPDTEFHAGSLEDLLSSAFAGSPKTALAGCRMVGLEGELLKTIRYFPTVLREASECLFIHRLFKRPWQSVTETVHDSTLYSEKRPTDWVSGAAMIARTEALREVGGFDEGFFLYAEEIDLCKRLRDAGWDILYDPSLTVLHVGGTYTTNAFLAAENQRSKLRYFLKHEGRLRMLGFALVVLVRLLIRSALWLAVSRLRGDEMLQRRSAAAVSTLAAMPPLVFEFVRMRRPEASIGHLQTGRSTV